MAKKTDMTKMSETELAKLLADSRAELRTHRFEAAGARPKETNGARKGRVTIARVLTEQTRRAHAK